MPMVPFYTLLPDLAVNETRTIIVQGRDDLPDGEYGFVEFYCNEIDCDCRRVIINVLSPATPSKIWATINFGWKAAEFYKKWSGGDMKGPFLDPLNLQTAYSSVLLQLFGFVLADKKYVDRLKRHYELFKQTLQGQGNSVGQQTNYLGRRRRLKRRQR